MIPLHRTAPAIIEHLDRLEALGERATKAALKANSWRTRQRALLSRLMSAGTQRSIDEKQEFMAEIDGWAENFAEGKLNEGSRLGSAGFPDGPT